MIDTMHLSWAEELIRKNKARPLDKKRGILYFTERGVPAYGCLADVMPSFLIGGVSGFGKTSAAVWYSNQIVMAGGRLVVIDPHYGAPRDSLSSAIAPLAPWLALPILNFNEVDTSEVVGAFQYILDEFKERKKPNGTVGKQPLFLIADEWAELLDGLDDDEKEIVLYTVRTVARAGRKYGLHLALISQSWNLEATGGSQVRKNVRGRIAFSAEISEMSLVLGTSDTKTIKQLCSPPMIKGDAIIKLPGSEKLLQRVKYPFSDVRASAVTARLMKLVYADPEYSGCATGQIIESSLLPANGYHPVDNSAPNPPIMQVGSIGTLHNEVVNRVDTDMNIQKIDLNNLNIRVSEQEFQLIVAEGTKQLQENGKVVRTAIRDTLGWDSYGYEKIKAVCDLLGWNRSMKPNKVDPVAWEAIKRQYDYTCQKCNRREPEITLEPDRIVPKALGGSYAPGNVQPLCRSCNASKNAKTVDYRKEDHVWQNS